MGDLAGYPLRLVCIHGAIEQLVPYYIPEQNGSPRGCLPAAHLARLNLTGLEQQKPALFHILDQEL
jgi:hypothetical protein